MYPTHAAAYQTHPRALPHNGSFNTFSAHPLCRRAIELSIRFSVKSLGAVLFYLKDQRNSFSMSMWQAAKREHRTSNLLLHISFLC
jgi:hypothetical protein